MTYIKLKEEFKEQILQDQVLLDRICQAIGKRDSAIIRWVKHDYHGLLNYNILSVICDYNDMHCVNDLCE